MNEFPVKKKSLLPAPSSNPPLSRNVPSKPPPSTATLSQTQSQNVLPPSVPTLNNPSKSDAEKTGVHVVPSKQRPLTEFNSLEEDKSMNKIVEKDQNKTVVDKVKDLLDTKSGVGDAMKDDLISVLAKRPNGVWAARLPFEFKV